MLKKSTGRRLRSTVRLPTPGETWAVVGAFAALTRLGAAAEELRLSPNGVDALLGDLLAAALAQRGRTVVRLPRRPKSISPAPSDCLAPCRTDT